MTLQLLFPFLLMLIAKRLAQFFKKCSRNPRDLKGSGATEIRSSAWLEHYTDNVGVSSSNLLGSTEVRRKKRKERAMTLKDWGISSVG